jgi:hypothetical protein
METKKIIGIVMLGASIGLLVYLYQGFLKPRLEIYSETNSGIIPLSTTTTTTK